MKSGIPEMTNKWLEKGLSYPGIDKDTLAQKKIYWISSLAVTSMILCLTIVYHIIFPQLRLIIYYGLLLSAIYLQGVIVPLFTRSIGVTHMFINSVIVLIATFFCILKFGGIPHSGGLVFVGLAIFFFTLNFRKKIHSLLIFIIYIITVILAGILHPYLKVLPEMTPEVNISLFVINLLWISGFVMLFVLSFISQRVKLEQLETNRIRELNDAKSRLYTNITHEFRTPLTIIKGMADLIRTDPPKWVREGSDMIDINAGILLNLVNQMLDLSRLEAGAMPARMIRAEINLYIRYAVELFQSAASSSGIVLGFNPCEKQIIIDFDPDKLMQIISNLLSNALKFTHKGGKVEVMTAMPDNENFEIRVKDNGPGIPKEYLPFIFTRFSRAETGQTTSKPGSGLGLALTMELVKILNGKIIAESTVGKGTEFIITLPVTTNAPVVMDPVPKDHIHFKPDFLLNMDYYESLPAGVQTVPGKPHLLIVEDNNVVIRYLITLLGKDYNVSVASNGSDALVKAVDQIPDLILSDVMMPVMDGIELLDRVKNDLRTSHIPVVLLTAKADISSRIEGLERGADAYIAKPFDREELQVQLHSLILQRKKLQERYIMVDHMILPEDKNLHLEDAFIKKIWETMKANLNNENYDIQRLCLEMTMSRTQLYRKFKSLTNRTPNDYFRSFRLQKAREMLMESDIKVFEAAYRTGFKNLSHFSKVFKSEFGLNPSEVNR